MIDTLGANEAVVWLFTLLVSVAALGDGKRMVVVMNIVSTEGAGVLP